MNAVLLQGGIVLITACNLYWIPAIVGLAMWTLDQFDCLAMTLAVSVLMKIFAQRKGRFSSSLRVVLFVVLDTISKSKISCVNKFY